MNSQVEHASFLRPRPGESVGGDAALAFSVSGGMIFAIVDVLGHGAEAHELTPRIEHWLTLHASLDAGETLRLLHQSLRGSRGAAIGIATLSEDTGALDYAGVGNTVIRLLGEQREVRLVSVEGVLGQNMRTPPPQQLALQQGDTLLMYTDGVSDRFSREDYPAMASHAPATIARNIVERFGKAHDDAACLVVSVGHD